MRVFVAGSTGTIGRRLVSILLEHGDHVVALVRTPEKGRKLVALGATPTVADPLDANALTEAIVSARPDVVIHELTALAGVRGNFRRFDAEFALTNRFRTEVADTMLEAALRSGARRFIAQSFCGWPFAREGGPIKTEEDPLDPTPPASFCETLAAIRHLEAAVRGARGIAALALRYGLLYGPGTGITQDGQIASAIRKRQIPIVGDGAGVWSFLHVEDAARATTAAVSSGAPGIYNVVDDEPARVAEWLPALGAALGAKPPRHVPVWIARLLIGEGGVSMMTKVRGASNAKAKRELGWEPMYPSWRTAFAEGRF